MVELSRLSWRIDSARGGGRGRDAFDAERERVKTAFSGSLKGLKRWPWALGSHRTVFRSSDLIQTRIGRPHPHPTLRLPGRTYSVTGNSLSPICRRYRYTKHEAADMVETYLNISQTDSNSTVEWAYVRVCVVRIVRGSSPDFFPLLLISTVYLDMYQFTLILTCYCMNNNLHIAIAIVSIL